MSKLLVVFDIDGTVANLDHRLKYVRCKPKNWPAFNKGIKFDLPIKATVDVCIRYIEDPNVYVIFASGRSDDTRKDTETWLSENGMGEYDDLYMRRFGDYRCDSIVKREILYGIIESYKQMPDMVFDDRPRVVKMWREEGIWVFDCNQSGVDF